MTLALELAVQSSRTNRDYSFFSVEGEMHALSQTSLLHFPRCERRCSSLLTRSQCSEPQLRC